MQVSTIGVDLAKNVSQVHGALRAHLAEFGLIAEMGREGLAQLDAVAKLFHLR